MCDHDRSATVDEAGDPQADTVEEVADRRVRAARIRQRSMELIEALGADHPLVTEALARADALEADLPKAGRSRTPRAEAAQPDADPGDAAGDIELRSSADLAH
jgi:hypothetical protein